MENISRNVVARASQSWQEMCGKLNVRIEAPYVIEVEEDFALCIAFLPDFGGKHGMVIGAMDLPEFGTDPHLQKLAKKKGLYCSFVNVTAFANTTIEGKVFKEALEDWGYYGPQDRCPSWFNGRKGGQSLP